MAIAYLVDIDASIGVYILSVWLYFSIFFKEVVYSPSFSFVIIKVFKSPPPKLTLVWLSSNSFPLNCLIALSSHLAGIFFFFFL